MSDLMLSAVLNMPLPDDPSQMDFLTWMQFRDRARQSADELDRLRAENERLRDLLAWAYDTLVEINPSNYDHDDVCSLNAASVEVALGIQAALQDKGDE